MKKVFKYALKSDCILEIPIHAKILKVGRHNDRISVWALVDDIHEQTEKHVILIAGTGHEIKEKVGHINTFFDGPYVWHAFEVIE